MGLTRGLRCTLHWRRASAYFAEFAGKAWRAKPAKLRGPIAHVGGFIRQSLMDESVFEICSRRRSALRFFFVRILSVRQHLRRRSIAVITNAQTLRDDAGQLARRW